MLILAKWITWVNQESRHQKHGTGGVRVTLSEQRQRALRISVTYLRITFR
jgi:hypothetical protein